MADKYQATYEHLAEPYAPLSLIERERCREVGRRLQVELRLLLESLPEHKRQSYALARELGIDRSICQRIVTAIRSSGPEAGLVVLERLPGVEGLMKFSEGARRIFGESREVQSVVAAIKQFTRVIDDLSGSHARLRARIRTTSVTQPIAAPNDPDWDVRRHAFVATSALARSNCDAQVVLSMTRPLPDDPDRIEHATARALLGYQSRPGAVPEVITFYHAGQRMSEEDQDLRFKPLERVGAAGSESLIAEFSTHPLPMVTTRGPKGMAVDVIDPSITNLAIDLVVARTTSPVSHPILHTDKVLSHATKITVPTKRLVLDSFVHRSIAASSVPAITVNHWHPTLLVDPSKCWHERLPGSHHVEVLGSADQTRESSAWANHEGLIALMFKRLGWPRGEFIVFRTDVEFPIWGAVYVHYFEFEA